MESVAALRQKPCQVHQLPTLACIRPETALHSLLTWKGTGVRLFCGKGFWGPDPDPVPCGLQGSSCGCHGSWSPENQPQECVWPQPLPQGPALLCVLCLQCLSETGERRGRPVGGVCILSFFMKTILDSRAVHLTDPPLSGVSHDLCVHLTLAAPVCPLDFLLWWDMPASEQIHREYLL